jgi:branched-chain amino acid transport system substrate-binding protein
MNAIERKGGFQLSFGQIIRNTSGSETMKKILAAALFGCAMMAANAAFAEPVKIGVITTLSGGGAGLGIDMRDAFQLAIKQSGNSEIELVVEDDAQKPELAVQIAEKMIQSDKVDLMTGIIWSNLAMAVVPNAVAQDVIYLSPNAGPSALAGANCHPNYFNVAYQNDNFHEAMGEYDNKDYKKTFILAPNYPAGKDALTGFKRYYKGELAGEVYTQVGQTDYAAEIAEIRASGADSVYFFLPGGMGIAFMKQYAQSGVTIPVTGPGLLLQPGRAAGDRRCGDSALRTPGTWAKDLDNPANKSLRREPSRRNTTACRRSMPRRAGTPPTSSCRPSARPSVKDKDAFRAALKAADFASVRGKFKFNNEQPSDPGHLCHRGREGRRRADQQDHRNRLH